MKRKATLRKLPPKTREIAKLLNELESTSKRLANRLEAMAELEKNSTAYEVMKRLSPEERKKLEFIPMTPDEVFMPTQNAVLGIDCGLAGNINVGGY